MKKIVNLILDFLFPINCLSCGKEGKWLCLKCIQKIAVYCKPVCLWCENSQPRMGICKKCRQESGLDFLWIVTSYQNPLLQNFLHNLKYNYAWKIIDDLNPLIKNFLNTNQATVATDGAIIVPIPLFRKRYLERGFNQSELIAKLLTRNRPNFKMETKALIRVKKTKSQMKLNRKERLVNIEGAFECPNKKLVKNKKVIIVDDVLTTGATIKEATKTLREAGCSSVGALVLAREELIFKRKNVRLN